MADVAVAGTFVGAVLEHMGYLTQARFLEQFQGFFRGAGAMIYLLAGAGAVVSVAVFGSFRAVQYLLVGPAFFWFLVGPTTKTSGVLWKIGGGTYLGELRAQGQGASEAFRNKVLQKVKENKGGEIDVAVGFWLFAYPINQFVNEFIDRMLDKESTEDLTANHKVAGLELIAAALPYEQNHIQRGESFAAECGRMLSSAVAAAQLMAQQRQNSQTTAAGLTQQTQTQINYHIDMLKHYAKDDYIGTAFTGFGDLIRAQSQQNGPSELAKRLWFMHIFGLHITCGDAWGLLAEETWHTAGREVPRVLRMASGVWEYEDALAYTCRELTRTLNGGNNNECNLRPGIALFMLYNQLTNMDTYSRVLARHWNQRDPNNPTQSTVVTGPMYRGYRPRMTTGNQLNIRRFGEQLEVELETDPAFGPTTGSNQRPTTLWAPMSVITGLHGMDHAMWVSTRRYEVAKLRQELYTYSMQLPYYQGVCLYFIAVVYPFMALIVLLPGKAANFINIPFAWLWVKSWDIGFAAVIVIDKVMYNLLPSWNVHESLRNGPWTQPEMLPQVLAQGYNYDPMGSIHIYYAVISMLTLSIPALTGAVTLRARRGILASFTDAPAQAARDRADIAGNMFSIENQNRRNAMMMQVTGFARMSSIGGAGKVDGGLRGSSGLAFGGFSGFAEGLNNADMLGTMKLDPGSISKLPSATMKGYEKFMGDYTEIAAAELKFDGALRAAFDPMIGRSGAIAMYQEAYASAMDGAGGFELSNHQQNAVDEYIDLYTKKTSLQNQAVVKLLGTGQKVFLDATAKLDGQSLVAVAALYMTGNLDPSKTGEEQLAKLQLADLKKALKAEAFSDEEFLARVFHVSRLTHNTEEDLKALKASPLAGIFKPITDGTLSPGGPSNLVDLYLSTSGGDRSLAPDPKAPIRAVDNTPVFNVLDPKIELVAAAGQGWNNSVQSWFGGLMLKRQDELTMRLEGDREYIRQYGQKGGSYETSTEEMRQMLLNQIGGDRGMAGVRDIWNQYNPGAPITLEQARDLSMKDLAKLMIASEKELHKKMQDSFKAGVGKDYDEKQVQLWKAEVDYYSLPVNNVGNTNTPALLYLAENNPLLAGQLMNEWQMRVGGVRNPTFTSGFTTIPSTYTDSVNKLFR